MSEMDPFASGKVPKNDPEVLRFCAGWSEIFSEPVSNIQGARIHTTGVNFNFNVKFHMTFLRGKPAAHYLAITQRQTRRLRPYFTLEWSRNRWYLSGTLTFIFRLTYRFSPKKRKMVYVRIPKNIQSAAFAPLISVSLSLPGTIVSTQVKCARSSRLILLFHVSQVDVPAPAQR